LNIHTPSQQESQTAIDEFFDIAPIIGDMYIAAQRRTAALVAAAEEVR